MNNKKTCVLGISIDILLKEELLNALHALCQLYTKDQTPRYATAINFLFFSHLHGWLLNSPRHQELLRIIRNANLVVLDSPWLCRINHYLGDGINQSISSKELLLSACELLNKNKGALYILGGHEKTNEGIAGHLRTYYPHVRLVGSTTPLILTRGNRLEESQERDQFIVEKINQAKPDILLLQLGHPKQEVWFERVRDYLDVPLTIGVGGAFERYISRENPTPFGKENPNKEKPQLSPSKKVTQFFKYIPDYLKYLAWLTPLLSYGLINRSIAHLTSSKKNSSQRRYFFLSSHKSLIVIPFPEIFTSKDRVEMSKWLEEAIEQDYITLDLGKLKHVDPQGIALIMETRKWAENLGKKLFILNVQPDVYFLFKLQGVWNYFDVLEAKDARDIIFEMSDPGKGPLNYLEFYESIDQKKNEVVLSFFGDFILNKDHNHFLNKLTPILNQKSCLLDFSYCTYLDNRGIGFLLKLKELQSANGLPLKIIGLNSHLAKQIHLAQVSELLS
ncbi:hypothetical protein PHSC3_001610 [Chlamydiales bacterium STE3]|nr:hypothetical protein PHSC3_001610 [Chlamydiales bacterium STE3]